MSDEERKGLRLVVILTLVSACCGAAYGAIGRGSIWIGALTGACDGVTLSVLEIFALGRGGRLRLRDWSFASFFALRVALYAVPVIGFNTAIVAWASGVSWVGALNARDVEFAFTVCVAINLLFSVNELLGPGVLFAFAAGRYRRPRREERALLYIDLVGSTALAERLGEELFLDFLNAFFEDVTAEIVGEGGEIHKYVGDEVIAVWPGAADPARPIRATFAAQARLKRRAPAYRAEFDAAPAFRAAIHAGPVVVGELGFAKKEIALIGDAMNTAARILEAARESGVGVLISSRYFERGGAGIPGISARRLPPVALRGKAAPLELSALEDCGGLSAAARPL